MKAPGQSERRGAILLIGAALLFSLMSVQVKLAGQSLPVEMLVLARGVVTLMLSYVWLQVRGIEPWGNDKRRLILRGVLGLGGLACFFYAVTELPLAAVTVIHYLNPVFTALLAALLLGERIDRRLVLAIALSLLGVVLVTRPGGLWGTASALSTSGVLAALGGAVLSAGAYVTVRRLAQTDNPHVIVFYFPVVAVPATLPFALKAWVWPSPSGWLLLLGIGVATQIAQVLMTRGLALIEASRGTTIGYVQIIFASLWGLVLFDETPSGWTVLGAVLIVIATANLLRPRAHQPPPAPGSARPSR